MQDISYLFLELNRLREELKHNVLENEKSVESYYKLQICLEDVIRDQWKHIRSPANIVKYLQPGRIVKVTMHAKNELVCLKQLSTDQLLIHRLNPTVRTTVGE